MHALLVGGCATAILVAPATARPEFQERVPNGENLGYLVAHTDGPPRQNVFATDFLRANRKWTLELCLKDSDGDGRSNGEELGDPECIWKEGDEYPSVVNITLPGLADSLDDARDFTPRELGVADFIGIYYGVSAGLLLLSLCYFDSKERRYNPEERTMEPKKWIGSTVLLGAVGLAVMIFVLRKPKGKANPTFKDDGALATRAAALQRRASRKSDPFRVAASAAVADTSADGIEASDGKNNQDGGDSGSVVSSSMGSLVAGKGVELDEEDLSAYGYGYEPQAPDSSSNNQDSKTSKAEATDEDDRGGDASEQAEDKNSEPSAAEVTIVIEDEPADGSPDQESTQAAEDKDEDEDGAADADADVEDGRNSKRVSQRSVRRDSQRSEQADSRRSSRRVSSRSSRRSTSQRASHRSVASNE